MGMFSFGSVFLPPSPFPCPMTCDSSSASNVGLQSLSSPTEHVPQSILRFLLHSERRCFILLFMLLHALHALHALHPLHAPLLLLCPFFAVAAFGAQVFGVSSSSSCSFMLFMLFILLFMFGVSFSFSLTLLANVDVFVRRSANKRKFR